jgi:hypothetical protein
MINRIKNAPSGRRPIYWDIREYLGIVDPSEPYHVFLSFLIGEYKLMLTSSKMDRQHLAGY